MENKKSDLTNSLPVSEARAQEMSGLSDVFTQCGGGADIQPLEDIVEEPMQPFEDNSLFSEEKEEEATEKSGRKTLKKVLIRVAVIVLVLCVIGGAGYFVFTKLNDYSHPAVAVYQKGNTVEILLDNNKKFEIENVVEADLSDDGSILVYSQNSTTKTGKFDIRVLELKKRSSVKDGGTLAVSGVNEGWKASSDCAYVYYSFTEENKQHYYAYLTSSMESQSVVSDAQDVFIPPSGDIFYFTRETSDKIQLFKVRIGEKASEVGKVNGVRAFSDGKNMELFYTVANNDSTYRLYRIVQNSEPAEIADNISEVYLDDYQAGENLYYFVKSPSKLNWHDFVDDSYADDDAEMEKPDREDYTYTVGFIFKRTKVDESAYNTAVQKYDKKLKRDSVRQALNQADLGLALSSEYQVKVFDGEKSRELSGGVTLENLVAYSKTGTPRIIVRKNAINSSEKISMDDLYRIALDNSPEQAVDYAIQTLKTNGYKINDGFRYSCCNNGNVYEYDFSPVYNVSSDTEFLFGSKNSIFAAVKIDKTHYSIFYSKVENGAVTSGTRIKEGVSRFESHGDKLYITVSAKNNVSEDLYICGADGSCTSVCSNVVDYMFRDGTTVVLRTKTEASDENDVELLVSSGGEFKTIDGGVYRKSILIKNNKVAYIKNYEFSSDDGNAYGGKMFVYDGKDCTEIDDDVSTVFDIS